MSVVAGGAAAFIAACGGITSSGNGTGNQPPVAAVTIALNVSSLTVGQSAQAAITLRDGAGNVLTGRTVTWASSKPEVATVSATGLVTARLPGTTNITATSEAVTTSVSMIVMTPRPSLETRVFSEDFESGTLASWQDGVDPTRHRVLNDPALAHSGSRVLEMTIPPGGDGGGVTRFFMPGYDVLQVRYWLRLEPTWQGSGDFLIIRGSRADNQWSSFGRAGACPSGADFFATSLATGMQDDPLDLSFNTYYPGMASASEAATCFGRYSGIGTATYDPNRRLTPGVWHQIEIAIKLNAVGRNDGEQRIWLDGRLVGEWTGLPLRTDKQLLLNSLTLDAHAVSSQTQREYIDDIEISGTKASEETPGPAPVAAVAVTLSSSALETGEMTQAVAVPKDASGNVLSGRTVLWSSSNLNIATVASGVVTARAVGTASITATSEGKSGSASLTVIGPPPSPPAGPGEPTYQPASDVTLFRERFEGFADKAALLTYNWTLQRYVYSGVANIEFPSAGGGHNSDKAVRMNYPVPPVYNDEEGLLEGNVLGAQIPGKFLVVEFWVRTKTGYPWRRLGATDQEGAGEKTMIWNAGSGTVPRFVMGGGLMPPETLWGGKYKSGWPASGVGIVISVDGNVGGTGTFWYVQNANGASRDPIGYMNDGKWHLWKVKLTPGTFQNRTGGDGTIEMWIDAVKVLEYIGSDATRPEYNQVVVPLMSMNMIQNLQIGGPFNGGPSAAQGPQWKDYDDIRIWIRP